MSRKISKIDHYFNFSRISFFRLCVKGNSFVAAFMFGLNIFQIFGPRIDIHFGSLFLLQSGIVSVICGLVLRLFREGSGEMLIV